MSGQAKNNNLLTASQVQVGHSPGGPQRAQPAMDDGQQILQAPSREAEESNDAVDTGLVQNRITIIGFVLTLLIFTSTVLLAFLVLTAQGQDVSRRADYVLSAPWVYVNTIMPVFLGFLFQLAQSFFC